MLARLCLRIAVCRIGEPDGAIGFHRQVVGFIERLAVVFGDKGVTVPSTSARMTRRDVCSVVINAPARQRIPATS